MWTEGLAVLCIGWWFFVQIVILIGCIQIFRYFSRPPTTSVSPTIPIHSVPHITIIRPVKGLEPYLYSCLAASFHQTYPPSRLTIHLCIATRNDPAYPILERLLADFPTFDARVFVEDEDPNLCDGLQRNLGPNPKIRNMSRAYREAVGDIVWIVDCNVWLSSVSAGLMVDLLCGFTPRDRSGMKKYAFVHQLPLAVDISSLGRSPTPTTSSLSLETAGGLLDEMFLSTAHAKFYTAISTVAIAPCSVGKSNMFRRSHLDALTHPVPGIDHFSANICEDHLIGDLLWRSPVPEVVRALAEKEGGRKGGTAKWSHHALLTSPPCIQPLQDVGLGTYVARRGRWLRVRKFTVPLATLIEPGTESLLGTAIGAWGFTTLPWLHCVPNTWTMFVALWVLGVVVWCGVDRWVWSVLQGWEGEGGVGVPVFVGHVRRTRGWEVWLAGWLMREVLAGAVWAWAVLGGTEVVWRGRRFKVGINMQVREVGRE